jgi:hypothetical protein
MEKISSTERVKEEVLHGSREGGRDEGKKEGGREGGRNEGRKIVRKIKRRKANWTGYTLRINCLQKHVIGVKMEGRRRIRRKQLLDNNKEKTRTGI